MMIAEINDERGEEESCDDDDDNDIVDNDDGNVKTLFKR